MWFPATPDWGLVVGCVPPQPPCVPSPLFHLAALPCVLLPWCLVRDYPGCGGCAVGLGGGSLTLARVPSPGVFSFGGGDACTPRQGVTLFYRPSICTRSVQMDLLRSQVLQPFPTPGSGTLWVAGESLRDRRVSCLPRWTVCPTRSPSLDTTRSTCCGECSWSGPLVTSPGRCHLGPLLHSPRRIRHYCVCSGGADTVTGGGGAKPLRLGPSPASPVGSSCPVPPLPLCWGRWWVFRHSWLGCAGGAGGAAPRHSRLRCLCARPRHPRLGPAARGGGWSLATPGSGSWVRLPATPGWGPLVLLGGWFFATPG